MRTLQDIVNESGVLLVAKDTILTEKHVEKLRRISFKIVSNVHVSNFTTVINNAKGRELVKKTEEELQLIEKFVRQDNKIPLDDIEDKVLPTIMEATKKRNVYQLFSDLSATNDFRYKQSIGVATLSTILGKWLRLKKEDLSILTLAASLYDIGSTKIPSTILHKKDRLEFNEYEILKQHTFLGYELIKDTKDLDPRVALVALQHHEREDGSGYPSKLQGNQIHPFSKIVSIVDVYIAMMSDRPHRPAYSFIEVIEHLYQSILKGKFDSYVGMTFLKGMMSAQTGSEVILTDDRKGKILLVNQNYPARPFIFLDDGEFIDLSRGTSVQIKEILG